MQPHGFLADKIGFVQTILPLFEDIQKVIWPVQTLSDKLKTYLTGSLNLSDKLKTYLTGSLNLSDTIQYKENDNNVDTPTILWGIV